MRHWHNYTYCTLVEGYASSAGWLDKVAGHWRGPPTDAAPHGTQEIDQVWTFQCGDFSFNFGGF